MGKGKGSRRARVSQYIYSIGPIHLKNIDWLIIACLSLIVDIQKELKASKNVSWENGIGSVAVL